MKIVCVVVLHLARKHRLQGSKERSFVLVSDNEERERACLEHISNLYKT